MSLYKEIVVASEKVNEKFIGVDVASFKGLTIEFPVLETHPRYKSIQSYKLHIEEIPESIFNKDSVVILDRNLSSLQCFDYVKSSIVFSVEAKEDQFKEIGYINDFIKEKVKKNQPKNIIGIGGGLILNVSAYIAEKLGIDLIYVPTSIIAMADGSIGGKVLINKVEDGKLIKNFYRSSYEPNAIYLDCRVLETLPEIQIKSGLGEMVKHGVYQSGSFLDYLASKSFDPIKDKDSLLKAVYWIIYLKKVSAELDLKESEDGARIITRGGHYASDKIEERTNFTIPHGLAVAIGVYQDVKENRSELLPILDQIYTRFGLPTEE